MVCVSVALLILVVAYLKNPWEILAVVRRAMGRPEWLLCAIIAFGGSLTCGTLRWRILARALGVPMGWRRTVQLYAVGHFYNVLIPGATGGDIVKAGVVATEHPGRRAEAVASILAERLIGFVALAAVVVCVALFRGEIFTGKVAWVRWYCLGFGASTFLGFVAMIAGRRFLKKFEGFRESSPALASARQPSRLERLRPVFFRLYDAIHFCMSHPVTFGKAFGLSMLNHIVTGLCAGFLGLSLGMGLGLVDVVCVMAVVSSVAVLSMTPGGAGVREVALAALLAHVGMQAAEAVAVSLLMFAVILLWAVIGGGFFVALRSTATKM